MLELTYQMALQNIRPYFSTSILKRGWDYYREDMVERFRVEEDSIIHALIYSSEIYRVRLELKQFSKSTCSCPFKGYCKHMAAVVFESMRQAELQPVQFLSPDRKLTMSAEKPAVKDKLVDSLAASVQVEMDIGTSFLGAASALTRASNNAVAADTRNSTASPNSPNAVRKATAPKATDLTADWHFYFAKQFERYTAYSTGAMEAFYAVATKKLMVHGQAWQPTLKQLYELHVLLFIMKRSDELQQQAERSHTYYSLPLRQSFQTISKQCDEHLTALVSSIDGAAAQEQFPRLLNETAAFLSEHAFPTQDSVMRWQHAYSLLWSNLLKNEEWIREEKSRLESLLDQQMAESKASKTQRDLLMSLAMFDVLEGQDEQAMQRTSKLANRHLGLYAEFLKSFLTKQEWERLIHWLRWLRPLVQSSGTAYLEPYFHYWQEAAKHMELEAEWQDVVSSMLPASYSYYSRQLLKDQQYQHWIDLQLLFERSPLDIDKESLKLIETHDRRLLLPLYHFSVERFILQKNRTSYKSAVRLLKKLNQYYKHSGEQEHWQRYLQYIKKQFSRFRAFQEELQKGKLVP